jgi:hypothetical protein
MHRFRAEAEGMRNLPRFALVPLAALVSILPFALDAFVARAGADTASDCDAAFAAAPDSHLGYTTDPPTRYALIGQKVSVTATWDPAAWSSLSSAVACVRLDNADDSALGASAGAPADNGSFGHSFTIPQDVPVGSRLCTRIRLAGLPAGSTTEAVWVSKEHCFEVDQTAETTPPPAQSPSPAPPAQPASSPGPSPDTPPTTAPDTPAAATPAASTGSPDSGTPDVFSPEGGGSAPGTPFEEASAPPSAGSPAAPPSAATSSAPSPSAPVPMLPATGFRSRGLLHAGEESLATGLALLVLFGRSRRRRSAA